MCFGSQPNESDLAFCYHIRYNCFSLLYQHRESHLCWNFRWSCFLDESISVLYNFSENIHPSIICVGFFIFRVMRVCWTSDFPSDKSQRYTFFFLFSLRIWGFNNHLIIIYDPHIEIDHWPLGFSYTFATLPVLPKSILPCFWGNYHDLQVADSLACNGIKIP